MENESGAPEEAVPEQAAVDDAPANEEVVPQDEEVAPQDEAAADDAPTDGDNGETTADDGEAATEDDEPDLPFIPYPILPEGSKALAFKALTSDVFDRVKYLQTGSGATAVQCLQAAFENPDAPVGFIAADAESYTTFAPLTHAIIELLHANVRVAENKQVTQLDDSFLAELPKDIDASFIQSTRIIAARNITVSVRHACPAQPYCLHRGICFRRRSRQHTAMIWRSRSRLRSRT